MGLASCPSCPTCPSCPKFPKLLLRFQPLLFTAMAAIMGIVLGLSLKSWRSVYHIQLKSFGCENAQS